MAFTNGTLLLSGGDVLTQLMDTIKAFMETAGWSTNVYEEYGFKYEGDTYRGKRLHSQKSIGGHTRYINLRSVKNQRPYQGSFLEVFTGIAAIASTGYDGATHTVNMTGVSDKGGGTIQFNNVSLAAAVGDVVTVTGTSDYNGNHTVTAVPSISAVEVTATFEGNQSGSIEGPSRWDEMTGRTGYDPINSDSEGVGCAASGLPPTTLQYWLFSQNSGNNIYLICKNSVGYTGIVFGVTTTNNYFCSGGGTSFLSSDPIIGNTVMSYKGGVQWLKGTFALRRADNSEWLRWPSTRDNAVGIPITINTNTSLATSSAPSIVSELLYCSPDEFKGNNPLIPSYIAIKTNNSQNKLSHAGTVAGIKYVNMKFVNSLTELTFSGDVYKLFRLYELDDDNNSTIGLAFLK